MFLQSVIASTFIPIFSGIFPCRIRGVPVIDGGFSVNQVVLNEGTVTVSPFAGDAHICPQDDVLDSDMITRVSGNYSGIIGSIDQKLLVGHRNRNNKWPKCLKLGKISASDVFVSGTGLPDSFILNFTAGIFLNQKTCQMLDFFDNLTLDGVFKSIFGFGLIADCIMYQHVQQNSPPSNQYLLIS